jgi:type IV pilus assembly protein PilY1
MTTMHTVRVSCFVALLAAAAGASGRELALSKSPLYMSGAVEPNVIVTFDDSASMEKATLPDSIDNNVVDNVGAIRGTWCAWRHPRAWSASTNKLYYDPSAIYEAPRRADGTPFPDAPFNAAPFDGFAFHTGVLTTTVDLATQYYPSWEIEFEEYDGDREDYDIRIMHDSVRGQKYCSGSRTEPPGGAHPGNDSTKVAELPFASPTHSEAFYYEFGGDVNNAAQVDDPINYSAQRIPAEQRQNFANWFSYYRARGLAMKSAASIPFATKADNLRIVWQNLNRNPITAATAFADFEGTHKNAFFDWLFATNFVGQTPLRAAQMRAGNVLARSGSTSQNPYWDPASGVELSCRSNYHIMLTDGNWNEVNPATDVSGEGDRRTFDLPDGKRYDTSSTQTKVFWNEAAPRRKCFPSTGNVESGSGEDDADCDPTLADLAFHYWATDARPDLENDVPPRIDDLNLVRNASGGLVLSPPTTVPPGNAQECLANRECYFNPANDPASWQHLVNFYVTFGVAGDLEFPTDFARLRWGAAPGPLPWPDARNKDPRATDDVWHAAVNSRGGFLSAAKPTDLTAALGRFLEVVSRIQGTASAATLSSGIATAGVVAYRSYFDLTSNTGDLRAYPFTASGIGDVMQWSAAELLETRAATSRAILTSANANGGGVPFRWGSLPADYRTLLSAGDSLGAARVDYLRGARDQEIAQGGSFRTRTRLLGPIVNSSAVLVGRPAGAFDGARFPEGSPEREAEASGEGFAAFATTHAARPGTLFVGANDGMMHAFDAATGAERYAFVPRAIAPKLAAYTRPSSGFEPLVDATPTVRDAFVGGRWRTVLVGTLRGGGQGVYALDVTSAEVTESSASSTVLWEFSDARSAQLGYTYQKANIVRLANGKWAAIVAGGYNNETADDAAGDGRSTIFVLDLETGEPMRPPFVVDDSFGPTFVTTADYEGDQIDDAGWFGDILGRVYRIDLASPDPEAWEVRRVFEPDAATPEAAPITAPVRLFPTTGGKLMVLFGTGKLLERADVFDTGLQSLYAIEDGGADAPLVRPADLVTNTLRYVDDGEGGHYTVTAAERDDEPGWRLSFVQPGERVVNAPLALFSTGTVVVNTIIPNGGNPCRGGLRGSVYVFDAATGGAPNGGPLIDTNRDGTIGAGDAIDAIGLPVEPTVAEGTPTPVVLPGGGYATLPELPGIRIPGPTWRRRYWREVK